MTDATLVNERVADDRTRHNAESAEQTQRLATEVDASTGPKGAAQDASDGLAGRRAQMDAHQGRTDFQGNGPAGSHLYGQNRGVGRTGSLTGVVTGSELMQDLTGAMYEAMGFSDQSSAEMAGQVDSEGAIDESYGMDDAAHYAENAVPPYIVDPDYDAGEPISEEAGKFKSQFDEGNANNEEGGQFQKWWGGVRDRYSEAQAGVTPPPLHVPDIVDGSHLAYLALQAEEVEARDNAALLDQAVGTAEAQLPELDAADALVQTQLTDIDGYQAGLDELQGRNDELASTAADAQTQAGTSSSKAGESSGMISSFVGPFISLMGRVPSRFVGNSSQASGGAQQMQSFAKDGPGKVDATAGMASEAAAEAGVRSAQNAAAKVSGETAVGNVNTLQSEVSTSRGNATSGLSELTTTQSDNDAFLATIESEKARLAADHAAASSEGAAWAMERQSMRLGDVASLESMLTETEARLAG
jgi:hypothetical protein